MAITLSLRMYVSLRACVCAGVGIKAEGGR